MRGIPFLWIIKVENSVLHSEHTNGLRRFMAFDEVSQMGQTAVFLPQSGHVLTCLRLSANEIMPLLQCAQKRHGALMFNGFGSLGGFAGGTMLNDSSIPNRLGMRFFID